MSDLYPTPTRLKFLRRVKERDIYAEAGQVWSHLSGSKKTAIADDCLKAGWIEFEDAIGRRYARLTEAGTVVLGTYGTEET